MNRGSLHICRTGWRLALALLLWGSAVRASEVAADSTAEGAAPSEAAAVAPLVAGEDQQAFVDPVGESYFGIMAKLGLGLGLVILLVWGAVWLLRQSSLGRQFGAMDGAIRVVERAFLAPKKAIYLVEIGDRVLALGVSEENIALLAEWPAGELALATSKPRSSRAFASPFKTLLGQMKKGGFEPEGGGP